MRFLLGLLLLTLPLPAAAQDGEPGPPVPPDESEAAPHTYLVLQSGEVVRGSVEPVPSFDDLAYLLLDGERYDLVEVAVFATEAGTYGLVPHPVFGRRVLLRETEPGRISLFEDAAAHTRSEGVGFVYFRKGDGPLLFLNGRNLRAAVRDHHESVGYLNHSFAYGAVGWAALLAGAGLATAGGVQYLDGDGGHGPLLLALSGVALAGGVNFLVPTLKRHARRQAIEAYNRGADR